MNKSEIIVKNMNILRGQQSEEIDFEFYEMLLDISKKNVWDLYKEETTTYDEDDESENCEKSEIDSTPEYIEIAHDFLYHLSANLPLIEDESDLNREFKRFLTVKKDPDANKLWNKISEALLELEAEGKVSRIDSSKGYNNRNYTIWFLPKNKGKKAKTENSNEFRQKIGVYRPVKMKNDSLKEPDIIPLSAAKELVYQILDYFGGELLMGNIFKFAKEHVILDKTISLQEGINQSGDDSEQLFIEDCIASPESEEMLQIFTDDEIKFRTERIWNKISEIQRKGIDNKKILCHYIIPKTILQKKINQSEFGPKSTVSMAYKDILEILKTEMAFEKMNEFTGQMSVIRHIQIKIILILNEKCSEIGLYTGLHR